MRLFRLFLILKFVYKTRLSKHLSYQSLRPMNDRRIHKNDFLLVWTKYNYEQPVGYTELLTI